VSAELQMTDPIWEPDESGFSARYPLVSRPNPTGDREEEQVGGKSDRIKRGTMGG